MRQAIEDFCKDTGRTPNGNIDIQKELAIKEITLILRNSDPCFVLALLHRLQRRQELWTG